VVMLREVYGRVLRDYREEAGMSMRRLAHSTGISYSYISDVERGKKEASSEMLQDLCTGLGLSTLDLLQMSTQELLKEEPRELELAS
jgi:transcriptional regulator with XRE-family HTH domain